MPNAEATIHFQQHVPNFVDVYPWQGVFPSVEAILARFDHFRTDPSFYRFSQSLSKHPRLGDEWLLMVEQYGGAHFWVLGASDTDLGLPTWEVPLCSALTTIT